MLLQCSSEPVSHATSQRRRKGKLPTDKNPKGALKTSTHNIQELCYDYISAFMHACDRMGTTEVPALLVFAVTIDEGA